MVSCFGIDHEPIAVATYLSSKRFSHLLFADALFLLRPTQLSHFTVKPEHFFKVNLKSDDTSNPYWVYPGIVSVFLRQRLFHVDNPSVLSDGLAFELDGDIRDMMQAKLEAISPNQILLTWPKYSAALRCDTDAAVTYWKSTKTTDEAKEQEKFYEEDCNHASFKRNQDDELMAKFVLVFDPKQFYFDPSFLNRDGSKILVPEYAKVDAEYNGIHFSVFKGRFQVANTIKEIRKIAKTTSSKSPSQLAMESFMKSLSIADPNKGGSESATPMTVTSS